jgi:hypothetical protein
MTAPLDPDKLPPQPGADTGPLDPISRFDDPSLRYRFSERPAPGGYGWQGDLPSLPPRRRGAWIFAVALLVVVIAVWLAIILTR